MTSIDGNTDLKKLKKTRVDARGRLIEIVAEQVVDSPDSLEQQNEVFRLMLLTEDEVLLGPAVGMHEH